MLVTTSNTNQACCLALMNRGKNICAISTIMNTNAADKEFPSEDFSDMIRPILSCFKTNY